MTSAACRLLLFLAMSLVAVSPTSAQSWPMAANSLLLDGARAGARLIVVGARGHILVSDDEAQSWRQVASPTGVLLTALHMHDSRLGWAVGHDAVIVRTRDGGETWQQVHEAPEADSPLLDVWFADSTKGFAIGAYGYFLATEDGGETWAPRTVDEDDYHLNALVSANGRRLYIAAEAGVAYRSDNGGATWRVLSPPYAGSWFGAEVLADETVLLVGLRGNLFRSDDGGETWVKVSTGTTATLNSVRQLTSGNVLITGLGGVLAESRDGGHSVSLRHLPERIGVQVALELADGGLLLVGESGVQRLAASR